MNQKLGNYIIYKATNKVNGKFYIGFTINLDCRIKTHIKNSLSPNQIFHHAIAKYGQESFTWEILCQSLITKKQAGQLEIKYIAELKPQYNMTKGGDGGWGTPWNKGIKVPSEKKRTGFKIPIEVRKKIGDAQRGKPKKPCSDARKLKMSQTLKGRTHSEAIRLKMGAPKRGRLLSQEHKKSISEGTKRYHRLKKSGTVLGPIKSS